jgi:hypothetical protein
MSARHLTHVGIMAALLLSIGCAIDLTPSSQPATFGTGAAFVSQDQAHDLAFGYRRQAADITDLARRIELEASVFSRQLGFSHQEGTRRWGQVKELLTAAEEANELARTYGRQVPHGQVQ